MDNKIKVPLMTETEFDSFKKANKDTGLARPKKPCAPKRKKIKDFKDFKELLDSCRATGYSINEPRTTK